MHKVIELTREEAKKASVGVAWINTNGGIYAIDDTADNRQSYPNTPIVEYEKEDEEGADAERIAEYAALDSMENAKIAMRKKSKEMRNAKRQSYPINGLDTSVHCDEISQNDIYNRAFQLTLEQVPPQAPLPVFKGVGDADIYMTAGEFVQLAKDVGLFVQRAYDADSLTREQIRQLTVDNYKSFDVVAAYNANYNDLP